MMLRPRAPARWLAGCFGAIALIAALGAFVGLGHSSLWIDELFTLHLIHHHAGLGEVWRRALGDTHPPLSYFLLYLWTRVAGYSDTALHLPSAVFAVAALAVFAAAARHVLSATAVAFACALAALSGFWFEQSQNLRDYPLALLLAAAMFSCTLALYRASQLQQRVGWRYVGLSVIGLLASFTHAYLLLAFGMCLLWLLLTLRDRRLQWLLVLAGLLVLALNAGYYHLLMQQSKQDLQDMWFTNSAGFFRQQTVFAGRAVAPGLLLALVLLFFTFSLWQRAHGLPVYSAHERDTRWASGLALLALIGVIVSGIGVSLAVAPSYSDRNLLTCAPFAWLLLGRCYDLGGPRGDHRLSRLLGVLVVVLTASFLVLLRGRQLPRMETWRQAAHYVAQLPGCQGQRIPVVLPYRFGHANDYFRGLAEHDFFGRYLPDDAQTRAYTPAELEGRHPSGDDLAAVLASRAQAADTAGGCTLLAWGSHDLEESSAVKIAMDLARMPDIAPHRVAVQEMDVYAANRLRWKRTPEGYLFFAVPPAPATTVERPALPPVHLQHDDAQAVGDLLVVDYLGSQHPHGGPPLTLDTFGVQRWSGNKPPREDFFASRRATCDPPTSKKNWDVWPNPVLAGCSTRPLPTDLNAISGRL